MPANARKLAPIFIVLAGSFSGSGIKPALAKSAKAPFTVADDIAYRQFTPDDYEGSNQGLASSPDGNFFAVLTARGRLDINRVEHSLRIYRSRDIESFLNASEQKEPPSPVWVVNRFARKAPISDMRWLADSSGVALLEHAENGDDRIVVADLRRKTTEVLSDKIARGGPYDISDRNHYAYVAVDDSARKEAGQKREAERRAPMAVFGGDVRDFLTDTESYRRFPPERQHLWVVSGGRRFELKHGGFPIALSEIDPRSLALSPDGKSLVAKLRIKNIPQAWEQTYVPPYPSSKDRLHAGGSAMHYVRIDLETGLPRVLTDAPVGSDAGWYSNDAGPSWSRDGQAILLPGTFIGSNGNSPSRPCMAVVDVSSNTASCVEKLSGHINETEFEKDYRHFTDARFIAGDKNCVELWFFDLDEKLGTIEYQRANNGTWQVIGQSDGLRAAGPNGLEISIKQGLNEPPLLIASSHAGSRTLWDPNPQFKDLELGQPKVYTWTDDKGRTWNGGLYMPVGYQPGERYPLVIQTHGFGATSFLPSGSYPTAFAARELAATGIAVLQVGGSKQCGDQGAAEASCEVSGFESGVKQLASDGIVDPQKVGYIGFSHSCWYGMEMLTNGSLPLKAALLADGVQYSYFEFILWGDDFKGGIGAAPVGAGLQTWIKRSPGFQLDKVNAPLLLATERQGIEMLQPFTALRYLHKPVELVRVNTDEHVITNPVERLASQGLSVDWFRFWLQGYEDPDPAKADQYKRWRELKKLQDENEKKQAGSAAASD